MKTFLYLVSFDGHYVQSTGHYIQSTQLLSISVNIYDAFITLTVWNATVASCDNQGTYDSRLLSVDDLLYAVWFYAIY